jgi:rhomboid protease GluP
LELRRRQANRHRKLSEPLHDPAAESLPAAARVAGWPLLADAHEHALVVLAMRLDCWVEPEPDGGFALLVDPADLDPVRAELATYASEQAQRRERVELPMVSNGIGLTILWALVLLGIFLQQQNDPSLAARFSNSNIAVFFRGEWWRPLTALFLHGDAAHLLGNATLGGLLCLLAVQTLGGWRGWLLILTAGAAGNALTGWAHLPAPHDSLGASTATFAALGLLVGLATIQAWRSRSYRELRPLAVPLVVGLVVLGLWGIGGERTDVAGHFAGWSCGVVLGLLAGSVRPGR